MRKIIVLSFLTLDGVMQAPGGPEEDASGSFKYGGWVFPFADESFGAIMAGQMKQPFSLLLGRKTFDIFVSYWPSHEDEWQGVNKAEKYVVSHDSFEPNWENTTVISGDAVKELKRLKEGDGPDLQVHGSSVLFQTLLENDLVDELWLKFFPVILGSGKRLFGQGTIPMAFTLKDSEVTDKGVIFANYARAGEVKTGTIGE